MLLTALDLHMVMRSSEKGMLMNTPECIVVEFSGMLSSSKHMRVCISGVFLAVQVQTCILERILTLSYYCRGVYFPRRFIKVHGNFAMEVFSYLSISATSSYIV